MSEHRSHVEQNKHDKKVTISFLTIVIISFIIISFFGYQVNSTHNLAVDSKRLALENKQRIIDNAQTRRDLLKASKRTDYKLCRQIKKLNGGFRLAAYMSFKNLDRNLALLHVVKTDEIIAAAKEQRDIKLARYKDINCKELRK